MKPLFIVLAIVFALNSYSQSEQSSQEEESLYTKLMSAARAPIKNWVNSTAAKYNGKDISESMAVSEARKAAPALSVSNTTDIEAMAFLVLMQASRSAQQDLKAIMANVKSINATKAKQREQINQNNNANANKLKQPTTPLKKDSPGTFVINPAIAQKLNIQKDDLSEMSESQQLKMQLIMDRYNKAEQAASNLFKKIADTQNQIIQNIK